MRGISLILVGSVCLALASAAGWGAAPTEMAACQDTLYFAIDDGFHGREVWVVRGPDGKPEILKDIRPGPEGSNPGLFTSVGNDLYFRADDGSGPAIWRSDGTAIGTVVFRRLSPIRLNLSKGYLIVTDVQNKVWKYCDAPASPFMRANITPSFSYSYGDMYSFYYHSSLERGSGFFSGTAINYYSPITDKSTACGSVSYSDPYATTLTWDGQVRRAGRWRFFILHETGKPYIPRNYYQILAIDPESITRKFVQWTSGEQINHQPSKMMGAGSTLYLSLDNELWKVPEDTLTATSVAPVSIDSPWNCGNLLLFSGMDSIHGRELWVSDGTSSGTRMIRDITPGSASTTFANMTSAGGNSFFTATTTSGLVKLWLTDGSPLGTRQLLDFQKAGYKNPGLFTPAEGMLYFVAETFDGNWALWRSNGQIAGTWSTPIPLPYNNAQSIWHFYP